MRFNNVKRDAFERPCEAGEVRNLFRILPVPAQDTRKVAVQFSYTGDIALDNLAAIIYGPGSERKWYFIANRNVRELVDFRLDCVKAGTLNIPAASAYAD